LQPEAEFQATRTRLPCCYLTSALHPPLFLYRFDAGVHRVSNIPRGIPFNDPLDHLTLARGKAIEQIVRFLNMYIAHQYLRYTGTQVHTSITDGAYSRYQFTRDRLFQGQLSTRPQCLLHNT
jgi:hypothetical protein